MTERFENAKGYWCSWCNSPWQVRIVAPPGGCLCPSCRSCGREYYVACSTTAPAMLTKPCKRAECAGLVRERFPSTFRRRKYCSTACAKQAQWASRPLTDADRRRGGRTSGRRKYRSALREAVAAISPALDRIIGRNLAATLRRRQERRLLVLLARSYRLGHLVGVSAGKERRDADRLLRKMKRGACWCDAVHDPARGGRHSSLCLDVQRYMREAQQRHDIARHASEPQHATPHDQRSSWNVPSVESVGTVFAHDSHTVRSHHVSGACEQSS